MTRARIIVPLVLALIVAAVAAIFLAGDGRGRDAGSTRAGPTAEALAFVPAGAPLVAVVATDPASREAGALARLPERFPALRFAVAQLTQAFGERGLDVERDLLPILGNDVVVAAVAAPLRRTTLQLSAVVPDAQKLRSVVTGQVSAGALSPAGDHRDARLYQGAGVAVATRGALVIVAGDLTRLRRALDLRAEGEGAFTPQKLSERLGRLNRRAVVRIVGNAEAFVARAGRGLREIPWVRALRRFVVSVRATDDGLDVRARLATDASEVVESEVPLALGPEAPITSGVGALTVGVRDLSHTLEFAQRALAAADPEGFARIRTAKALIRTLGRLDLDSAVLGQLRTDSTVTADLSTVTLRATADDSERLARALRRLRPFLGPLLSGAGLDGADVVAEPREEYRVEAGGEAVARFGLAGDAFVLTSDPAAEVRRVAGAPPSSAGEARGALSGRLRGQALRDLVARRLGLRPPAIQGLAPLGDVNFSVRAERDRVEGRAELRFGR